MCESVQARSTGLFRAAHARQSTQVGSGGDDWAHNRRVALKRHVIIGNGGAGVNAAKAIRCTSYEDDIIIISRESCRAYSPVLATHYLAGHISYDDIFFVDDGFYERNGIRTLLGRRVISIDPHARVVGLEDGYSIAFDNLLIATGSKSIVPRIPGVEGSGVFTLGTADDAKAIDRWARRGNKAIVVGAGLIGMQTLEAMMCRGLGVTLLEKLDQVLPLVLDAGGAALVQRGLREQGVDLRLGDAVSQIADFHGHKIVFLESGDTLEGDLVIMATGVSPNLDLALGCGAQVGRGIVVNEFARTSVESIYAAGDVAEAPDSVSGVNQINATWFNAAEQGRVAGLNMAGVMARYVGNVRMNISFPLGIPVASVGPVNRTSERQEEVISQLNGHYRKLIFEGHRLVGAVLVGDVEEIGILTCLLRGQDPSKYLKVGLSQDKAFSSFARNFFAKTRPPGG